MEIRFLREHEVKEAVQLMKRIEQNNEFIQKLNEENMITSLKEHQLYLLGAFDKSLIGVACVKDYVYIQSLCADHQTTAAQLLNKIKQLTCETLTVQANQDTYEFYINNGFVKMDDSYTMAYTSEIAYQFQTYDEVHDFIAKQKDRVYALDSFKKFMDDMCNPQIMLKAIHIGGTNGKGSTTNYIRAVLQQEGYKVATFTSPVLITRLEVMRIDNKHIQEEEIIKYASRYMNLWLEYGLSMFEIEVFIAIMFFLKHGVDFALFEVGLGGELDATNIISPILSANTNIGLDHVDFLGHTYEEIARTKGGIIKESTPFITGEKKEICLSIFKDICDEHHSPFLQVQSITNVCDTETQVTFDYRQYHVTLNTSARYQSQNCALAIEILLYLKENGYIQLEDHTLLTGLSQTKWEGRFEIVHHNPLIIIDGAHNKEGMQAFYESASKYQNIKIIFSALRDKDTHAMMEKLLELTDDITVCEFDFYRAQTAEKLAESFPVKIEKDWHKAIDDAFLHKGVVFVTGSLYFISKVRPYLLEKQ